MRDWVSRKAEEKNSLKPSWIIEIWEKKGVWETLEENREWIEKNGVVWEIWWVCADYRSKQTHQWWGTNNNQAVASKEIKPIGIYELNPCK